MDGKHNHVAQKSHRLFVGAADELMHRFHQLLGTENFGGMQPPVDPHDGLAVFRELAGLIVSEPFGECEASRDVLTSRGFCDSRRT